ncbi:cytochrome c oxidase accessory protein CcoG [Dechloromonas sp. A34]|uniref:cytochrome c oxidase accessory protein CcoG n=1 Tax=Dechloromonas sp. A34 TaxID=447588 RepID=UPI00224887DC|nr:cytochrome c oxidase accessory protein CcoG [Dechloromonas sp. A34]
MDTPVSKIRTAKLELYRKKGKIHAKAVDGRFNTLRWTMVWLTQIVFYGACWLEWEVGGASRQAVLFDIAHEKLYLFGLVLWPQDALLLAIALIIAALGLFFVTALAGRLFCGFVCPQTVYTSIFVWIETKIEGDHLARLKLDQSPMTTRKLALKSLKHGIWLAIAGWTAITFVGYFSPIRDLLAALPRLDIGPWEGFWLIFYGAFTYVQAGLAREAVCQHMCPYARFQGVMFDPATRNVAYDSRRGEPRHGRLNNATSGDCIDCGICVEVCPTGIDIRHGLQYQCINCGLCIDACDQVMTRTGAPTGLIRFASAAELAGPAVGDKANLRPRIAVYIAMLTAFSALGAWSIDRRPPFLVDVIRDRGALHREMPDGRIENAYTLKLMNLTDTPQELSIDPEGMAGLEVIGQRSFPVAAGSINPVHLTLSAPGDCILSGLQPITLRVSTNHAAGRQMRENTSFFLP